MGGRYNLQTFSLKRDTTTNILRMTLTGDRAPDQTPIQTIKGVPRPAELDDWRLCGVVEERAFREAGRGDEYADWQREETGDSIGE
ncbi:hypothetical protein IMZ48_26605 [Candidatus Bathyarchaeota archaeon]|nr:hypothetical protein [Candidatus Bathyarchaeota archaeon]